MRVFRGRLICLIAVIAIAVLAMTGFAHAQTTKLTIHTDFRSMTPDQVLNLLQNANRIQVEKTGGYDDKFDRAACNGGKKEYVPRENYCQSILDTKNVDNPRILLHDMQATFRGCGLYANSPHSSMGGQSCGILGRFFYHIGNVAAARAVWEQAPGCHAFYQRTGLPVDGCVQYVVGGGDSLASSELSDFLSKDNARLAYQSDPKKLLTMAAKACTSLYDRASCEFLQQLGVRVDMNAVRAHEDQQLQAFGEAFDRDMAASEEKTRESDERFNAIMGALQSMPGGNDPNAILDTANQQAAAMRAIGDANSARQQQAAQDRIASQQAIANLQRQQAADAKAAQPAQLTTSMTRSAAASGNSGAAADPTTGNSCSPVVPMQQPPAHKDAGWGPWAFLSTTGVAVSVSHVDSKTLTWEFFNGRPDKVTTLNFTYSYIDADTGQNATKSDIVPLTLKPGDGLGGWTAYTANTRGTIDIAITQMVCQ